HASSEHNMVYLSAGSLTESMFKAYQGNIESNTLEFMDQSTYGNFIDSVNEDHTQAILGDAYSGGDHIFYLWRKGDGRALLYGKPIEQRTPGEKVAPNSISNSYFTPGNRGLLLINSIFEDSFGPGYLDLRDPREVVRVPVSGTRHPGT